MTSSSSWRGRRRMRSRWRCTRRSREQGEHLSPGFRAQILRAVSSIADNLAEGCAKRSRRELARYADDAYASSKEVENDLIRARDLGILERRLAEDLLAQGDEVSRLCFGLSRIQHATETMTPGPPNEEV